MAHATSPAGLVVSLLALALCLLLFPSPAAATTVSERQLLFSFDGAATPQGPFAEPLAIAIDYGSGAVYVLDASPPDHTQIRKFDRSGEPVDFSLTGAPAITVFNDGYNGSALSVDNSATNPGRIYLTNGFAQARSLGPDGAELWMTPLQQGRDCGSAVDAQGHFWVSDPEKHLLHEYASSGSPPPEIAQVLDTSAIESSRRGPCTPALDADADLYLSNGEAEDGSIERYRGGAFDSVLAESISPASLVVDQSAAGGHLFATEVGQFVELDPGGGRIGVFGEGILSPQRAGAIAYEPGSDRVYVADPEERRVLVFGPVEALGSAPDVEIKPTTSDSLESAHLSGTINPLGLANSYHFEYKVGRSGSWSGALSTPTEHISPADSSVHQVSAELSGLQPFTPYQARLVATNDEAPGLRAVSATDTFGTGRFATLTLQPASGVGGHGATLSGSVDPAESETNWRLQTSTTPGCGSGAGGFVDQPSHSIAAGAGVVAISETLSGLRANQHYCARVAATNSPGTEFSEIVEFDTTPLLPLVTLRGAAPRSAEGARLNAFLNPENAPTSYRFEYSAEGGEWSALASHDLAPGVSPVPLSEELAGLHPGSDYRFRLSAESLAGSISSEPEEFTTLPASAPACPNADVRSFQHTTYLGSCRALELVNKPEKGNQGVSAYGAGLSDHTSPPISLDGEKVLWSVASGAPGAPTGTEASFLAERSARGWVSRSLAPPAAEQLGGGEYAYLLNAASPDFDTFLFSVRYRTPLSRPAPGSAVRIRGGVQDILKTNVVQAPNVIAEESVDLSDDGTHVLALDPRSAQLEDIGSARVGPPESEAEVLSLMPGGLPSQCGLDVAAGKSFPGLLGSALGHPGDHWTATEDASRVYFRAPPDDDCAAPFGLYVRNREVRQTTLIDPTEPELITASPDGHRAYFVTRSSLDPSDTELETPDLYLWDEDAGAAGGSRCLTCSVRGPGVSEGPAHLAELEGALASVLVSEDFTDLYFYSRRALLAGAAQPGSLNLYALDGDQIRFVATTSEDVLRRGRGTVVSRDGRVLLFAAKGTPLLTADSLPAKCISAAKGEAPGSCEELYRYQAGEESLECLSCRHEGLTTHSFGAARISLTPDLGLSGDGAVAAFPTKEALLPADVNADTDLYEWRAGAAHLLTDGLSDFQEGVSVPWVWAIDGDGENILFGLVPPGGSLTGFERDGVLNLYDARAQGGFLPPPDHTPCEGESCQGPLISPPPARTPASATYRGHGNLKPAKKRCRKGRVRRRGRCAPRHRKSRHRSHRGHDRGGAR